MLRRSLALLCLLLFPFLLSVSARPKLAVLPRTSFDDSIAQQAIRRRQASSRDIVRRMKEGPRRREGASAAVCASQASLVDGDFNKVNIPDWNPETTEGGAVAAPELVFAQGQANNTVNGGTVTISQTITLCQSAQTFKFQLGSDPASGTASCPITASVTLISTQEAQVWTYPSICVPANTCTTTSSQGNMALDIVKTLTPFSAAGPALVKFFVDCTAIVTSGQFSMIYSIDTVSITRVA